MKKLLILGSLSEMTGLVIKSRNRGIYTIVCDGHADGPAREYADDSFVIDVKKMDEIAQLCLKEEVDGIITSFSDIMFECMVKIAEKAGLPCYVSSDQLPAYRDKEVTKKICRDLGLNIPRFIRISSEFREESLTEAGIVFPAVMKPIDSYGSRGIHMVSDPDNLRELFDETAAYSGDGCVMLENVSPGCELNCQAFLADGRVYLISIADRVTAVWKEDDIPINYANRYPSDVYGEVEAKIKDIFFRYAAYTGQKWGPMAMQCFWDGENIHICEMTARYFGFEHELTELSSGLDIEELLLDLVLDRDAAVNRLKDLQPQIGKYAEGLYLTTVRDGILTDQSSMRALINREGVIYGQLFYHEGDKVGVRGPNSYFARYFIQADSRQELERLEKDVLSSCTAKDEKGEELLFLPKTD